MPQVERLGPAWNRWVYTQRATKGPHDDRGVPIRLRGYSELHITSLTANERKYIDSSLRRGYTLSKNNRPTQVLPLITQLCDFHIGYMGKSKGSVWFPDQDMRDRCHLLMEAQLVITDKFCADQLRAPKLNNRINIDIPHQPGTHYGKAYLKEIRHILDEFMAEWAYPREQLADALLDDDWVIRVPFDSHLKEDDDE